MVGRDGPAAALMSALVETASGSPAVVLISGEAGIGKTRLVKSFIERARESGAVVLVGGCLPIADVNPPYTPLVQAFRAHLRGLPPDEAAALAANLPPELTPATAEASAAGTADQRAALYVRLVSILTELSEAAPVALVVEDVHCADRSTLDILSYVVHSLGGERVLLVVSYRDDEADRRPDLRAWVVQLRRAPRVLDLPLEPLGRDDVVRQMTGITGARPDADIIDAVTARADGNPLFVEELVAAGPSDVGQRLPATLTDVITARLEQLPEATRRLLRVAAAVGRRTNDALLSAAGGIEASQLAAVIRPALAYRVLTTAPGDPTYEFHHELVREAAYAELLPGERARVHAAIARWLTDHQPYRPDATELALIAHHWTEAGDPARAIPALVTAGASALRSAGFAEAFASLSRALRWSLETGESADLLEVALMTVRAGNLCGDMAAAYQLGEAALAHIQPDADPHRYGELIAVHGVHRTLAGDGAGARAAFEHALSLLPEHEPSRTRATLLFRYGFICGVLGDPESARRYSAESVTLAHALGDREIERDALRVLGPVVAELGDTAEGERMLRRSLALARDGDGAEPTVEAYIHLSHLAARNSISACLAIAREGIANTRRLGLPLGRTGPLLTLAAMAHFFNGDWDDADRMWLEALARPIGPAAATTIPLVRARLRVARGEFARAAELLPAPEAVAPWGRAWVAHRHAVAAELAIWQRQPDQAGLSVSLGAAALGRQVDPDLTSWLIALAERAVADKVQLDSALKNAGIDADALLRSWIGDQPRHPPVSTARMRAWLAQADAERTRRGGSDPAAWESAVQAWDDYGDRWQAAYARFRRAEALLAHRAERAVAAEPLARAWAFVEAAGAQPLLAEVTQLARRARVALDPGATGLARAEPMPAPADPVSDLGLTTRELDVLRCVADGRTNAEIAKTLFISEKTAGTHVSNILRKLGVARRTEAATIAHRLGLLPSK
jgi:ATP/maltotriose-dependent transcriptional regulator MalT